MADELRPFFCLDLSYAHTLLTKGFKIPDDAQITLVRCLSAMPVCVCLPALRRQCWRALQQACFVARLSPLLPCSDHAKQAHKETRVCKPSMHTNTRVSTLALSSLSAGQAG